MVILEEAAVAGGVQRKPLKRSGLSEASALAEEAAYYAGYTKFQWAKYSTTGRRAAVDLTRSRGEIHRCAKDLLACIAANVPTLWHLVRHYCPAVFYQQRLAPVRNETPMRIEARSKALEIYFSGICNSKRRKLRFGIRTIPVVLSEKI
ncbi:hypothetical protein KM043_014252 [Ampulex compressa]|nr:hypothetical protein KM043_014252 [Ampulex compressa]